MKVFEEFLNKIEIIEHRAHLSDVLEWVHERFPDLEMAVKWNQPMFMDHGTFIIAFSVAKAHFALAPEYRGMEVFSERAKEVGYSPTKMLIRIKWNDPVDYEFLEEIIRFNIEDKKECETFWRKE